MIRTLVSGVANQTQAAGKDAGGLPVYPSESHIMAPENRIHAAHKFRQLLAAEQHEPERVWRESLPALHRGVTRLDEKKDIGKSGPIISATALDIFVCVGSELWMPARCSGQSPMRMTTGGNPERLSHFYGESGDRGSVSLWCRRTHGLEQAGPKRRPAHPATRKTTRDQRALHQSLRSGGLGCYEES